MKIILFWDMMPFSPLQIYQRCTKKHTTSTCMVRESNVTKAE